MGNIRLGIDFGTTHTVIAAVDRGNYPIVNFQNESGETMEWYPSLAACRDGEWRYGLQAMEVAQQADWVVLRSFKRLLGECGPEHRITVDDQEIAVIDLLVAYLSALRVDLVAASNLELEAADDIEVLISVPANANNNQRFLTAEAFRLAGFRVLGMINEPTAAGVEFVHRFGVRGERSRKHYLLVFDLGGGTFDAAVIGIGPHIYETVATEGVMRLGGDDFDEVLLDLVLQKLPPASPLTAGAKTRLLQECREKKESLHPNTRKIIIDLEQALPEGGETTVSVTDYYQACEPLVERCLEAVGHTLAKAANEVGLALEDLASLYIVGGGSHFPLVNRKLREHFNRLVRRSAFPHGAAAVGLAITADSACRVELREQFTRDFGVWREDQAGREIVLDRLFIKGTQVPAAGEAPVVVRRAYTPTHNIGYFRYLECGRLNESGMPEDDLTVLKEIQFPFDRKLQNQPELDKVSIEPLTQPAESPVEEIYSCDSDGIIELTIRDTGNGYEKRYVLVGDC